MKLVGVVAVFLSMVLTLLSVPAPTFAEEVVDWDVVNRIRDEGFNRSQVMETLRHLTDEIGPRLTASPQGHAASRRTSASGSVSAGSCAASSTSSWSKRKRSLSST